MTRPLGSVSEAAGADADAGEPEQPQGSGRDGGADGGVSPVEPGPGRPGAGTATGVATGVVVGVAGEPATRPLCVARYWSR